ncbi:MAG: Hpt domain-containing protein [Methylophilaceae bacterium]|nr:Hpt domain-containing protein [Methylophilaceae bacterium]
MDRSSSQTLTDRFRREFIDELGERFRTIERLIISLENTASSKETLATLFRIIHSIKGGGSTFGLQILAAICHPFEELIQNASEAPAVPKEFIGLALAYLDLLQQTAVAIQSSSEDYDLTEKKLAALHQQAFHRRFSMAVVVNARMLRDVCFEIGKSLDARLIQFDDSYNALQRVLTEPFDVVIASSELYPLRGEALIAAINLSYRHAQGLATILISASQEKARHVKRDIDPDFVVLRDKDFVARLQAIISGLHQKTLSSNRTI